MTDKDYFVACQKHDWLYEMTDDMQKWKKGKNVELLLHRIAMEERGKKLLIFSAFCQYWDTFMEFQELREELVPPKMEDFLDEEDI